MRIFLRIVLFTLHVFLSPLINLIQAIITENNPGNQNDILIIIHDMFDAHKSVLPSLNYSKKTIPDNTFYTVNTGSTLKNYISNTNTRTLYEN